MSGFQPREKKLVPQNATTTPTEIPQTLQHPQWVVFFFFQALQLEEGWGFSKCDSEGEFTSIKKCLSRSTSHNLLTKNPKAALRSNPVPGQNLPQHQPGLWEVELKRMECSSWDQCDREDSAWIVAERWALQAAPLFNHGEQRGALTREFLPRKEFLPGIQQVTPEDPARAASKAGIYNLHALPHSLQALVPSSHAELHHFGRQSLKHLLQTHPSHSNPALIPRRVLLVARKANLGSKGTVSWCSATQRCFPAIPTWQTQLDPPSSTPSFPGCQPTGKHNPQPGESSTGNREASQKKGGCIHKIELLSRSTLPRDP